MNFIEAAQEVLKQNNNTPMSAGELWAEIARQNLVITNGKTPWATLDTNLRIHMKDSKINPAILKQRNPKCIIHFEGVGVPVKFKLINNTPPSGLVNLIVAAPVGNVIPSNRILMYQITSEELQWETLSVFTEGKFVSYERAKCPLYTYVIRDAAHSTRKIGKTASRPEVRLAQLRTANPSIELDYVYPSTLFAESDLHNMFVSYRKDLEWFFMASALEKFLKDEKEKHNKVLKAYKQSVATNLLEQDMLSALV